MLNDVNGIDMDSIDLNECNMLNMISYPLSIAYGGFPQPQMMQESPMNR